MKPIVPLVVVLLAASAAMQTPVMNALTGVIGTVLTGLVVAAIAGIFLRRK